MTFQTITDEKQIVSVCFKIRLSLTLLTNTKQEIRFLLLRSFSYLAFVDNYVTYTSKLSAIGNQVHVCGKVALRQEVVLTG
jgi:hypothetical protein